MEKKTKVNNPIPTIESIWEKEFMTDKQYGKILKHLKRLKTVDSEDSEEVEKHNTQSIRIIKGLLERAVLLDAYKDMTSDLYCTCNESLIPEAMRKLFIFLGPKGKEIENSQDREYRVWREK